MSAMTDEQLLRDSLRKIRRILRTFADDGPESPEEMARQYHACLAAAAAIRLRVGGFGPDSDCDGLVDRMSNGAFEGMESAFERYFAARN